MVSNLLPNNVSGLQETYVTYSYSIGYMHIINELFWDTNER